MWRLHMRFSCGSLRKWLFLFVNEKTGKEVKWANKNGTGYGDIVLTEKNFPTIRGGHNCRHNVIAIVQNDKAEKYLNSLRRVINSRASQT